MLKVAILISGSGTNMEAVLDYYEKVKEQNIFKIEKVIANKEAKGIEKARKRGFSAEVLNKKELGAEKYNEILFEKLKECDIIVLAGYLAILDETLVKKFRGRIINIHPSLLPKFGGHGMYGLNVHRAVLTAGEKESGCTVHLVDEGIDTGSILIQKKVPVLPGDDEYTLQARILEKEHEAIVEGLEKVINTLSQSKNINIISY